MVEISRIGSLSSIYTQYTNAKQTQILISVLAIVSVSEAEIAQTAVSAT